MSEPNDPNEPTPDEHEEPSTEGEEEDPSAAAASAALPELSIDAIRELLTRCRENPDDENSLVMLNELREFLLDPMLAQDVAATALAVTRPVVREESPTPVVQAHMVILLSFLLDLQRGRDAVDQIFVEWLRHKASYGPGRSTPPMFQKTEFVQRIADLLGWGSIDVVKDREALERFLDWVDSWSVKNRFKVRRALDVARRAFGAPELWRRVHYPKG